MSFLLSFIATIADLVTKLSLIPAASFPSVVPEQGHSITASIILRIPKLTYQQYYFPRLGLRCAYLPVLPLKFHIRVLM